MDSSRRCLRSAGVAADPAISLSAWSHGRSSDCSASELVPSMGSLVRWLAHAVRAAAKINIILQPRLGLRTPPLPKSSRRWKTSREGLQRRRSARTDPSRANRLAEVSDEALRTGLTVPVRAGVWTRHTRAGMPHSSALAIPGCTDVRTEMASRWGNSHRTASLRC